MYVNHNKILITIELYVDVVNSIIRSFVYHIIFCSQQNAFQMRKSNEFCLFLKCEWHLSVFIVCKMKINHAEVLKTDFNERF